MKIIAKVLILMVVASLVLSTAFAEDMLFDYNYEEFTEADSVTQFAYFNGNAVRGYYSYNGAGYSYVSDEGDMKILSSIPEKTEPDKTPYNSIINLTSKVNSPYTTEFTVMKFDFKLDENNKMQATLRTAAATTDSTLFVIEKNTFYPYDNHTKITDESVCREVEPGRYHNVKIIVNAKNKVYALYLDGQQVGEIYNLRSTGDWSQGIQRYYVAHYSGTADVFPAKMYIDNFSLRTLKDNDIDIYSYDDYYDGEEYVKALNPQSENSKIAFDVFNKTDEEKEVASVYASYSENENGFKVLEGFVAEKSVINPGINRVTVENLSFESKKRLFMADSLVIPSVFGKNYILSADEEKVNINSLGIPQNAEYTDEGYIEVINNDSEVTVTGINRVLSNDFKAERPVSLTVIGKDKTKEELLAEYDAAEGKITALDSLVYFDVINTNKEGEFKFKYLMPEDAELGDYTLIAKVNGAEYEATLRYVTTAQKQDAMKAVNDALKTDAQGLSKAISDNSFALSALMGYTSTQEMYDAVKESEGFFNIMKSMGTYDSSVDKVSESIISLNRNLDKAILLAFMDAIEDSSEVKVFAEENGGQMGLRLSGVTEENADYIFGRIAELPVINSLEEINRFISEETVFFGVTNAFNWGAVKTVITDEAEYLGLDVFDKKTDYSEVYRRLYNERAELESFEETEERFNYFKTKCKIPVNTGNGGGGGGFSGGSSSNKTSAVSTPQTEEKKETVKVENVVIFKDVTADFWGYDAISELYSKGIVKGISETEFAPDSSVKREEFVAMLVRAANLKMKEENKEFTDVPGEAWYKEVIDIAFSNGIISGRTDGSFGAGESITRQDIAVIIGNMLEKGLISEKEDENKSFNDMAVVYDYARSSVERVLKQGIISGYSEGDFRPLNNATRAETAAIIYRILDRIKG